MTGKPRARHKIYMRTGRPLWGHAWRGAPDGGHQWVRWIDGKSLISSLLYAAAER